MPELACLDLCTTDAAFNLAAEQYVFDSLPRDRSWFLLWQNRSAVVIGKYQDALAEIDLPYVRAHGIQVVRRLSGGGAVYHDLGNLNFSFITDAGESKALDMQHFCGPIVRSLAALGVRAELNGRNDLTIDGRKCSGSAQYLRGGRILHHGTLLFDSDLAVVSQALRPDAEKIRSRGLPSVRSRVTNIRPHLAQDCSLPDFRAHLLADIRRENGGTAYRFTAEDSASIEALRQSRYARWDWNFGASPPCTLLKKRRFESCGTVEAHIDVEHGLIRGLRFRGDFFSAAEPEELAARFIGIPPERDAYAAALADAAVSRYIIGLDREGLLELLNA